MLSAWQADDIFWVHDSVEWTNATRKDKKIVILAFKASVLTEITPKLLQYIANQQLQTDTFTTSLERKKVFISYSNI